MTESGFGTQAELAVAETIHGFQTGLFIAGTHPVMYKEQGTGGREADCAGLLTRSARERRVGSTPTPSVEGAAAEAVGHHAPEIRTAGRPSKSATYNHGDKCGVATTSGPSACHTEQASAVGIPGSLGGAVVAQSPDLYPNVWWCEVHQFWNARGWRRCGCIPLASATAADAASKPKTGLGDGSEIHRDGGEPE